MRTSEIYRYPIQTSAFQADPLQQHRQKVREALAAGPETPMPLDTTLADHDALRLLPEEARAALRRGDWQLGRPVESVKAVHTPAYTRGSYTVYADDNLRLQAELGPLIWIHTQRGNSIGGLLDTFA